MGKVSIFCPVSDYGLLLSQEEFDAFSKAYIEKACIGDEEICKLKKSHTIEDCFGELHARALDGEDNFVYSQVIEFLKETPLVWPTKSWFNIDLIGDENECQGFFFSPFKTEAECFQILEADEENYYVVPCDKNYSVFEKRGDKDELTYENRDELIDEMKAKTKIYLPNDFDFEAHIGYFEYCKKEEFEWSEEKN